MTDKYTDYQCSVCKSRDIVGRVMMSGLQGFRCATCGDTSPYKISDLEDASEGKSKYMTIKEATDLLDDHSMPVLGPPTGKSRKLTPDELALNSVAGLSPNDVSEMVSSLTKRPFRKLSITEFEEVVVALDLLSEHSAVTPFLKELLTALHVEAKIRIPTP